MGIGTLILFVAAILIVLVLYGRRSRSKLAPTVTVNDVNSVLDALRAVAARPAFAGFMFHPPNRPPGRDPVSLQFSTEDGDVGFDWVLVGERNVQDEERFVEFARGEGYTPVEREKHNVKYLRVSNGDLARLTTEVLTTMYRVPLTHPIDLIVEGFAWEREGREPDRA